MPRYPNISDHGLIGDLQTAALVTRDGTVDFFCCPRFDSASVFASLLGRGAEAVIPDRSRTGTDYVTKQLYLPGTAILTTRFMTPDGVGEVLDFMPVIDRGADRPAPAGPRDAGGARHHALRAGPPAPVRLRPSPSTS